MLASIRRLSTMTAKSYEEVLHFWFDPKFAPSGWYKKDDTVDNNMREKFLGLYEDAAAGKLECWLNEPKSALALIIILDQFSRNMFRGSGKSFAADPMALKYAQETIAKKHTESYSTEEKAFVYMPFMHSEDKNVHETAVKLFSEPDMEGGGNMEYELMHKKIIDRFGRYPHRNEVLGRESTAEELEFLKEHGGF